MTRSRNKLIITNKGFTLIEIALVLLVIGVAFLGIMGVGRGGQDSIKEADNTARCDNLASALFETLEIYNQRFSQIHVINHEISWTNQWYEAIEKNRIEFPPVAGMSTPNNIFIYNDDDDGNEINFYYTRAMKSDLIYLGDWHPYYALTMKTNTTSTVVFSQPNMFDVWLHILPDGDTYSSEERIYTTTLIQHGGLK